MKIRLIALLAAISMAMTLGCDDPEDTDEADEQEEVEEEADDDDEADEEDEEAAADDEDDADEDEVVVAEDGTVTVEALENTFAPTAIEAPAGEELTIEFVRETEDGCMDNVAFDHDEDLAKDLPTGETVTVEVTPEEGEAIGFACDHGMGESTITGT